RLRLALPTPSPALPVLPQQAGGEIPACRPPPRLRRYSPSKLGEKSRPADPLPGSAGTPPASWGRNPGLPTPSPAPPVLPQQAGGEIPACRPPPQQAGGKILATPARPNMPGENPLGDR